MVGRDHVAQTASTLAPSMFEIVPALRHALEIGRVLNIGRCGWPVVGFSIGRFDALPFSSPLKTSAYLRWKASRVTVCSTSSATSWVLARCLSGRRRCRLCPAQYVCCKIDVQRTGQRIGHDEWRRGQIVGAHIRGNAPFEVAVAGQNGCRDQVTFGDGI